MYGYSVLGVVLGALIALIGTALSQLVSWLTVDHQRKIGRARIRALLREARFYADRAANEIAFRSNVGIYTDEWTAAARDLRGRLDSGDNNLNRAEVSAAYTAQFCCQETLFASDNKFAQQYQLERVKRAAFYINRAQTTMGDADPEIYMREQPGNAS